MAKTPTQSNGPSASGLQWINYQAARMDLTAYPNPILCPMTINMVTKKVGSKEYFEFKMDRMTAQAVTSKKNDILESVPFAMKKEIKGALKDYDDYFDSNDKTDSAVDPGPLDIHSIRRPVFFIIYLKNANWVFSGPKQLTVYNDRPVRPLVRQISCFDGNKGILFERHYEENNPLKYDYHVTIYQSDGTKLTDIIIDPRDDEEVGS